MILNEIRDNFELLDEWEDRYRYVIELGHELELLPETERSDANKVNGCVSQVWVATTRQKARGSDDVVLTFKGDSDAHIVRGLVAIVFAVFSGLTAREILQTDAEKILADLGLKDHLTPQRSNGLASLVRRIRSDAEKASTPA